MMHLSLEKRQFSFVINFSGSLGIDMAAENPFTQTELDGTTMRVNGSD
jgi:hypothetical protein